MHILPLLKPGVVVHVHEMFGSAEDRIHPDLAYNAGRGWTETEFLLAFLYKNPEWKTLILEHGSWWLQKVK